MALSAVCYQLARNLELLERIHDVIRVKSTVIQLPRMKYWLKSVSSLLRYLDGTELRDLDSSEFNMVSVHFELDLKSQSIDLNHIHQVINDELRQGLKLLGKYHRLIRAINTLKRRFKDRYYSPEGPFASKHAGPLNRGFYEAQVNPTS
jgi:hypothetical protein